MKKDIIKFLEKKEKDIEELNLSNFGLQEIPNLLKFINVKILNLMNNKIKKIDNIPTTVHTLILSNNQIEKLNFIPSHVNILYINRNLLTEIDIRETNITELYCQKNKLTNLYLSKNLKVLSCENNKLTSLDNLPNTLNYCNCSHNKIKFFNNLPNSLEDLDCSFNQLFVFDKIPDNLKNLDIGNNKISEIKNLPNTLKNLYCSCNKLKNIILPPNLIYFNGSHNNFLSIITNDKLENLNITCNNFYELPELPDSLIVLSCCFNSIKKIIIPINLEVLYCYNCKELIKIYFNNKLELLSCSLTLISNLDDLPNSIIELDCSYTKVKEIKNIPNDLIYLNVQGNDFTENDIKYFDLNIPELVW